MIADTEVPVGKILKRVEDRDNTHLLPVGAAGWWLLLAWLVRSL